MQLLVKGASLALINSRVDMRDRRMRLVVDADGTIESASEPLHEEANLANNLSSVEYELAME